LVDVAESSVRIAEDRGGHHSYADKEYSVFTALTPNSIRHGNGRLFVPSADSLSLARLVGVVQNLSPIERLYSTVVRRAAHAADDATSSLDALQPIFDETWLEDELTSTLAECVPICQIRRVIASYTHSHLHMIKLDLVDSIDREVLVDTLQADSRILVGATDDGFFSTADIQEFFRDNGRIRADRWESFVWEESILVDEKCVYLMQDISPDAISVPEVIDAIRLIAVPQLSLTDNRRLTDHHLGMLQTLNIVN
jgi:glyceraldehyde-3-phosphate dehydrogenase type II